MTETTCSACSKAAVRKCTGCGKLFCNLHVRQGDPQGLGLGAAGHYCDVCWEKLAKWNLRRFLRFALTLLVGGMLIVALRILAR